MRWRMVLNKYPFHTERTIGFSYFVINIISHKLFCSCVLGWGVLGWEED